MSNNTTETTEADVGSDDLDVFANELFGRESQEPEVVTDDTEESESTEQDPEPTEEEQVVDESDVEEEEQVEEQKDEQPRKKSVQDRIDELVRQREDAKREAQAEVQRLREEFEAKLADLQPKQETVVEKESGEPTPDDLDEEGNPKYDLGEFDPKYIRDLTRYTLEQERQRVAQQVAEEAKQLEQSKAQQELATKWNEKVEAAVAEYPDFIEKGQQLINSFDGLDASYGAYLSTLLMSMDKGPEVLYYLSNNPTEASQIVNSGAQRATLALGRIEAKFLKDSEQEPPKVAKTSKAPPPPPPQARARGANGAFISVSPDTDDLDAFTKEFFK